MIIRKTPSCPYRVNLGYMSDQKVFNPVATIHIDDLSDLLSNSEDGDIILKGLRKNESVEVNVRLG